MNAPRLYSVWFNSSERSERWERMARVLAMTAAQHLPSWRIEVAAMPQTPIAETDPNRKAFIANSRKLWAWNEAVRRAEDGDRLLLIDADTIILRPLDPIWEQDFEIAYAQRSGGKYPINGGVVFVRVSPATRRLFDRWLVENLRMLNDEKHHAKWKARFGGINQAALGFMQTRGLDAKAALLDCVEWNCEDSSWHLFDPEKTRIVHVKSALRLSCFVPVAERSTGLGVLARLWREKDREATSMEMHA